jgi:hypothetical protein
MSILDHMLYPYLEVLMLAVAVFGIRNEGNSYVVNNK